MDWSVFLQIRAARMHLFLHLTWLAPTVSRSRVLCSRATVCCSSTTVLPEEASLDLWHSLSWCQSRWPSHRPRLSCAHWQLWLENDLEDTRMRSAPGGCDWSHIQACWSQESTRNPSSRGEGRANEGWARDGNTVARKRIQFTITSEETKTQTLSNGWSQALPEQAVPPVHGRNVWRPLHAERNVQSGPKQGRFARNGQVSFIPSTVSDSRVLSCEPRN